MGQSASVISVANTFSQNVQESINSVVSTTIQNTSSAVDNTQVIKIGSINCPNGGGVINQTMISKVNVDAVLKALDQTTMQQTVNNAIDQALKKDQSNTNGFMSFGGGTNDSNTAYQNNVNKLYNSFDYNTFSTTLQNASNSQSIDITEANGLCNITQNMEVAMAVKAAVDKITDALVAIATDAQQQQALQSSQANTSTGPIQEVGSALSDTIGSITSTPIKILLIFIGIIIGVILLVMAVRRFGSATAEDHAGVPSPVVQ